MKATIFGCYNIGQGFDFHNLVIRKGSNASDADISSSYNEIKSNYDHAVEGFKKPSDDGKAKDWWKHPDFEPPQASRQTLDPLRKEKLKSVFELMRNNCDIVLLQEVVEDIELVKTSFGEKFKFSYKMSSEDNRGLIADALVCWNKEKFEKIKIIGKKETSQESDERCRTRSAIVRLKEIGSNKIFDIASVHAPGYFIKEPTEKNVVNGEKAVELINKVFHLNQDNLADISIVAGDFNSDADPTYYDSVDKLTLSQRRFKLLTDKGFGRVAHNQMTAYNSDIVKLKMGTGECALDHIFVKSGKSTAETEFLLEGDFHFPLEDPSKNPSDHLPLFFKVVSNS